MKHYVYIHFKKDNLEPFYIGKGTGRRINQHSNRNRMWTNTANKHGVVGDFLKHFETHEEALDYEVEMISFFKAEGFRLCNLTAGGDGTVGYKRSQKLNELVASKNRGLKRSKEAVKRISEAHLNYSEEAKAKMTIGREGKGNPAFKGTIYATSLSTKETIALNGVKDIEAKGFLNTSVYKCLQGKFSQHKGYTFSRTNLVGT
jgi:predicted GIY-YIG superfamily endonuclease